MPLPTSKAAPQLPHRNPVNKHARTCTKSMSCIDFAGSSYEITTLITVWFLVRIQAGPPQQNQALVLPNLERSSNHENCDGLVARSDYRPEIKAIARKFRFERKVVASNSDVRSTLHRKAFPVDAHWTHPPIGSLQRNPPARHRAKAASTLAPEPQLTRVPETPLTM